MQSGQQKPLSKGLLVANVYEELLQHHRLVDRVRFPAELRGCGFAVRRGVRQGHLRRDPGAVGAGLPEAVHRRVPVGRRRGGRAR